MLTFLSDRPCHLCLFNSAEWLVFALRSDRLEAILTVIPVRQHKENAGHSFQWFPYIIIVFKAFFCTNDKSETRTRNSSLSAHLLHLRPVQRDFSYMCRRTIKLCVLLLKILMTLVKEKKKEWTISYDTSCFIIYSFVLSQTIMYIFLIQEFSTNINAQGNLYMREI